MEYEIPIPSYDLLPNKYYRYPFVRNRAFATVLTDYGCPFKCSFCIMSKIGFKFRSVSNVMQELRYLKDNGFREIYFNDQTFAANKKRTRKLLDQMIKEKLNFGWVCFSRVDVIDEPLMRLMKQAGCHTIMIGVESIDSGILEAHSKGIDIDKVNIFLSLCKKYRIRSVATFIMGLPGETKESALKTIEYAKNSSLDYAAFNVAIPRMGTDLRKKALQEGTVDESIHIMDQSGDGSLTMSSYLTADELIKLKDMAYKEFYFTPKRLVHMVGDIRTFDDFFNHVRNGLSLLSNIHKSSDDN
jgi:radical SAM superfamily enzyme YgiQ (UPF0313 family)